MAFTKESCGIHSGISKLFGRREKETHHGSWRGPSTDDWICHHQNLGFWGAPTFGPETPKPLKGLEQFVLPALLQKLVNDFYFFFMFCREK